MRNPLQRTSVPAVFFVVGLTFLAGRLATGAAASAEPPASGPSSGQAAPPTSAPATTRPVPEVTEAERLHALAQKHLAAGKARDAEAVLIAAVSKFPDDTNLRLAWIDAALALGQHALALKRCETAPPRVREMPAVCWRRAQAYYQLGTLLGDAVVRSVRDGRAGQFDGDWLLVEARRPAGRFLCSPPTSALYQLRRALDAGFDQPAAHVLHARVWQKLGRAEVGLNLLQSREAALLLDADPAVLEAFSDLARQVGAIEDFLRYEQLRATRCPPSREQILQEAYLTVAETYNQRGDEALYIHWLYRAHRLAPADADVLLRLGDAEWERGNATEAVGLYRTWLQQVREHPERSRVVARLAEQPQTQP